ncbi:MAG TPA: bifunctional DNA-formamidopyrimidine glycosylase/DNA-(apurinic or apyrimidinic site) lyase [Terracidiphilus sp.]|nr:bifunctional DNA-formamidopyrimidine glycosylase/DNA-(apurinic or apyrimidinic site) lyase [Terracidiphilus sp.]
MPELPEVETVARTVHERVRGDRILEVWLSSHPQPFKTPPEEIARGLSGRVFLSVHRSGKHIVCELGPRQTTPSSPSDQPQAQSGAVKGHDSSRAETRKKPSRALASEGGSQPTTQISTPEAQWIVHLGMTGRLLFADPDSPLPPHTHARLTLASGRELRFVDPRRFGRLAYKDLRNTTAFLTPGIEPLAIGPAPFAALFRSRRTPIKAALLNQALLAGIGNIYADEGLFRAGIHPRRMAGRLTRAELERLRLALRQVLQHAIRLGGSSVSDYVNAAGEPGFFQMEHCVYQRTGLPCRRCATPIRRILIAGRGTHFCPQCQR